MDKFLQKKSEEILDLQISDYLISFKYFKAKFVYSPWVGLITLGILNCGFGARLILQAFFFVFYS